MGCKLSVKFVLDIGVEGALERGTTVGDIFCFFIFFSGGCFIEGVPFASLSVDLGCVKWALCVGIKLKC